MDDLVTWYRAQLDARERELDEDERVAREATTGPWRHNPDKHWRKPGTSWFEEAVFAGPAGADAVCVAGTGETDDPQSMADAAHIARWDPDRVLRKVATERAEIDAKRHMVAFAEALLKPVPTPPGYPAAARTLKLEVELAEEQAARMMLKLLALPMAGREGYRPEWRPA